MSASIQYPSGNVDRWGRVAHVVTHVLSASSFLCESNSERALFSPQIITVDEAKRRQSFSSFEADLSLDALPLLGESSALLQDTHVEKVRPQPPPRPPQAYHTTRGGFG